MAIFNSYVKLPEDKGRPICKDAGQLAPWPPDNGTRHDRAISPGTTKSISVPGLVQFKGVYRQSNANSERMSH